MTPKDKARELVDKYENIATDLITGANKECALIAIDEIIELLEEIEWDYGLKDTFKDMCLAETIIPYYQEVKQEIELL